MTVHCVDRFWERAASGCTTFAAALQRLRVLAARFGADAEAPLWAGELDADAYVELGADVGLVVRQGRAVTCVVRGGISETVRDRRNRSGRRRPRDRGR